MKVLAFLKRLINMSQTTLVMFIHFFTSSQDATKVDATYNQLLTASIINHKNVTKTEMKSHMHQWT